jgi:hypothetical protein
LKNGTEVSVVYSDHLLDRDQPFRLLLHDFQVVVEKTQASHPERGHENHLNERLTQVGPKKSRDNYGDDDQHATHRRRAGFAVVGLGTFLPDRLTGPKNAQASNEPRAQQERERERGYRRVGRPKRDVSKDVKERVLVSQWNE